MIFNKLRLGWPARAETFADKYPLPLSRERALCRMIETRQRKDSRLRRHNLASNWPRFELWQTTEASVLDTVEQYLWLRDGGMVEQVALEKIEVFQNGTADFSLKPNSTLRSYIAHRLAVDGSNYLASVKGGLDDVILVAENWARDEILRVKSEQPFPPIDWLKVRITVSDIESGASLPFKDGGLAVTTPDGQIERPGTTIKNDRDWKRIKLRMQPTDELWTFSSPVEHWQRLAGRMGIALIRNGRSIGYVITLLN